MPQVTVIGDITIDNFISLSQDYIYSNCKNSGKDCELILPYGGKIPVDDVEVHCGGNAANVAVGLKRLGISILAIIPLGRDVYSTIALGALGKEGIDIHKALMDENYKCNSSYIFRYTGDRTIFSHHEPKEYPLVHEKISNIIYYSSHSGDNNHLSTEVLTMLKKNNNKLIFAPANTHIHGDKDILEGLIGNSYLFICNKEEATTILSRIDEEEIDINYMMHRFHHFGAHHVVITNGEEGVNFLDGDTEETLHLETKIEKDKILDATGAGDAMCTGILYCLVKEKSLKEGVELGLRNSASVLSKVGAQTGLLHKEDI